MKANNLQKIVTKRKKRIGRGAGSGKGFHTVGRGQKGQRSRSGNHTARGFIGGQAPMHRVLPRQSKSNKKPVAKKVSISITEFIKKDVFVIDSVAVSGFTSSKNYILVGPKSYEGLDLKKVEVVNVPVSKSLSEKITSAGGKVQ